MYQTKQTTTGTGRFSQYSISKVCKNEIDVLVEGGYIRATAAQDENYPGIDVEFVPNKPQEDALSFPRVLVEKPLDSDNLRAVIWANPNDEDYSDEIKFTSISYRLKNLI